MQKLTVEVNAARVTDKSEIAPGIMVTPPMTEDYWLFRVKLSDKQSLIAFPKFGTIGIGFSEEKASWNTNLPWTAYPDDLFHHIIKNKGDDSISDETVEEGIKLLQDACQKYTNTPQSEVDRFRKGFGRSQKAMEALKRTGKVETAK